MPTRPNDYALVIGIEKYPEWNQGRKDLQGPVADAGAFFGWLKDTANGGGLPETNIELVVTADVPGQARPTPIGQDISDALKRITKNVVLKNAGPPDRFYLFFSGHGHTIQSRPRDTNLCMAPFSEDRFGLSEALSLDDILGKVTKCLAPGELLVFLDCCRSIITNAAGVDTTFACVSTDPAAGEVREAILYATLNFSAAFEGGDVVRGHFSRALLEGLYGAAQENGEVTLGSLHQYMKLTVPKISKTDNHHQEVDVVGAFDLNQVVFGKPRSKVAVRIEFDPLRAGEIVLENGSLQEVRRGDAGSGPWELELDNGLYVLRETGTGFQEFFSVQPVEETFHVRF